MDIKSLLKQDEGLRLDLYRDSHDNWTIGYGRNLTDTRITLAEAEYLLDNDIRYRRDQCDLLISSYEDLDEVRQAVLISMAFNLGISGLLKFKRLLVALHFKRWEQAAAEILDSDAARELVRRYIRLAEMMRTGEWPKEDA